MTKSFATKIIKMFGYSKDEAIAEIAAVDDISYELARERYETSLRQRENRCLAQQKRRCLEKQGRVDALNGIFNEYFCDNSTAYSKAFWKTIHKETKK